jgi:hypothetical protein
VELIAGPGWEQSAQVVDRVSLWRPCPADSASRARSGARLRGARRRLHAVQRDLDHEFRAASTAIPPLGLPLEKLLRLPREELVRQSLEALPHHDEAARVRTYGWADEYVFGRTQDALAAVRTAARRRPADAVRPKPFTQVALFETDPDDDSLAEANRRRGWPPRLRNHSGELRDYVVIACDKPRPELRAFVDDLVERRARKRAGAALDASFEGRLISNRYTRSR